MSELNRTEIEEKVNGRLENVTKQILLRIGNALVENRHMVRDGDGSNAPLEEEYVTIAIPAKDMKAAKLIGEWM